MTKTAMIKVGCGKCGGNGRYYFAGGSDICFPCNGTGKIRMSKARHERILADRAAMAESWAKSCAEDEARQGRVDDFYHQAERMIETQGIRGARVFFATHRDNAEALAGLIGAMRDVGMYDAANAVVIVRNKLPGSIY